MADRAPAEPPPLDLGGEPKAVITQTGRWSYSIEVVHGLTAIGPNGYPWHRLGRKAAERKASRELARYKRYTARCDATWEIR